MATMQVILMLMLMLRRCWCWGDTITDSDGCTEGTKSFLHHWRPPTCKRGSVRWGLHTDEREGLDRIKLSVFLRSGNFNIWRKCCWKEDHHQRGRTSCGVIILQISVGRHDLCDWGGQGSGCFNTHKPHLQRWSLCLVKGAHRARRWDTQQNITCAIITMT